MTGIRRILCPVDFSENSETAAAWARDFAEKFEAELHFVYVMAPLDPIVPEPGMAFFPGAELVVEIRKSATKRLAELAPQDADAKVVREGSPFVEIVQYARQNDVDLIVMGTHGRTGLSHMLLGSVAEKVVRKAHCAVLVVRPDGQPYEMP